MPQLPEQHSFSPDSIPVPTQQQLEWADLEVGVLIHLDVQVFEPGYEFRQQRGYHPDPGVFRPASLDTEQWIDAARSAGAKYAVLVAKHCSGFCLWPTHSHEYSVRSASWKNGGGDIVGDFIQSCRKVGLKPGIYYSSSCNAYLNVDNPGRVLSGDAEEQKKYNETVLRQLRELWSNYGELFEIWFDGGALPPSAGGPDLVPLLQELQPNAVVFQGPKGVRSQIRWAGTETGGVPYPCWSTTDFLVNEQDGVVESAREGPGDPDGSLWAPAEADVPARDQSQAFGGGWFWKADEDHLVTPAEALVENYYASVGRNANLLIGMVIDDQGLVPKKDAEALGSFGSSILTAFQHLLAQTSGEGDEIGLELPGNEQVTKIVLMEDIAAGERVREYTLTGRSGDDGFEIERGSCIGHKRIIRLEPVELDELRLHCTRSIGTPRIRRMMAFA